MKDDSGYFYSIEPVIDIDHFVELLLICLAANSKPIIFLSPKEEKNFAFLPTDYLACIEKILREQEFGYYFAELIDFHSYYEHQLAWENRLKDAISKYGKKNNKELIFNLEKNMIQIEFTKQEIEKKLAIYDQTSIEKMERFCRLVTYHSADRETKLARKESKRQIKRKYIRSGPSTFSNTWND